MTTPTIGNQIRAARILAGMSAADLAKKLKVKPATVGAWERDERTPPTVTMLALIQLLPAMDTQRLADAVR